MINPQRLREALYQSNMKSVDLAKALGVTEVTISRYLHGTRKPGDLMVRKMAEILHVVPEFLRDIEEQETPEEALSKAIHLSRMYRTEWCIKDRMKIIEELMM